ncbi:MAG TPA: ubiquinol-cytochrome c reductase iron-sulfur subunit [Actinomycetota bacterium]|nr:ubiquinol-cytochrome c reductase iron-sulfur subunit [Actinomycetota bacterium]
MSPTTIALIIVAVSVAAWGLFMANVTIRRQRKAAAAREADAMSIEQASVQTGAGHTPVTALEGGDDKVTVEKVPPKQRKPLTLEQLAVSRRQFLNRAWTASFSVFLGVFGMSSLSFLWPKLTGGFGTKITVGQYEDLLAQVGPPAFKPLFIAEGRFWLTYYEGTGDAPVYLAVGAQEAKMQALYRKCVHLGCSVPFCDTSLLFECPCHGSKYRLSGEFYGGPAPRGLDRFPLTIEDGKVVVDTGARQDGPPRGTNTWEQFAEPVGSFCVPT